MASSRVVQSPFGKGVIAGGLVALLLGLLTFNLLLLLLPLAVLALASVELVAFDRSTLEFGSSWFRWQRLENSAELPIDGVGSMAIDLTMVGPRPVYAELFDPQPDSFEIVAGSPRLLTWWPAGAPARLAYIYRPRARGRFRVGPTVVVAHDPLGLGFRVAKLENRWEVVVTPDLTVERASEPTGFGLTSPSESFRRRAGLGTEFRSLREYATSDDARRIAWRRSGIDKLYVRELEEESQPQFLVLLDCGREMRLGPKGEECLEQAIDGATILAGQTLQRWGRVGLLAWADAPGEFVAPERGARGAELLTRAFGRVMLSLAPFDLARALDDAGARLHGPTTVVLFSTLLPAPGPVDRAVGALRNRGHRLVALCPEIDSLFPPEEDLLAERTLRYALVPVARRVDEGAARLRRDGALVFRYRSGELGGLAAAIPTWTPGEGEIA
jgi:uncharacterized protein (DUF58 family)